MKAILFILCLTVISCDFLDHLPEPENLFDFIRGNLDALHVFEQLPHNKDCIRSVLSLRNNTKKAVREFKTRHYVDAITTIDNMIAETNGNCLTLGSELSNVFEDFLKNLAQPHFVKTVFTRLAENSFDLITDFARSVEDLKAHKYYEAGNALGQIPHILLSGTDEDLTFLLALNGHLDIPPVLFAKGFLKAMGLFEDAPELTVCNEKLSELKDLLDSSKDEVKNHTNIFKVLAQLTETIDADFKECKLGFGQAAQAFKNFMENAKDGGFVKNLLANGKENWIFLLNDVAQGVKSLKKHDWEKAGEKLGNINHVLLAGKSDDDDDDFGF